MPRKNKRPRAPLLSTSTTEIAIVGSGLAALSTAIRLEQAGFERITIYERDACVSSRREGYGLTLKYDPKGVLAQLGILEACALADCPSRSHYLLTAQGQVRGYYGNAFSSNGGYGQRGNLRVPRQIVRQILMDTLKTTKIEWGYKLIGLELIEEQSDGTPLYQMRLDFYDKKSRFSHWVIGADGIRSTVADCILSNAPPPQPMGVRLILGLTSETVSTGANMSKLDPNHLLLRERGFYTLAKGHRLFVMPYSAASPLHPERETRYMWQLSFAEDAGDPSPAQKSPRELIDEALERCRGWHTPVRDLIEATPLDAIWSTHLCDRDPKQLQDLLLKKVARQQGTCSDSNFFDRVIIIGDALHAMSCFKGQGANQALLDGVVVAKWFAAAANGSCTSPLAMLRGSFREIIQRTAPIVAASRTAARFWHSKAALQEGHTFAGVPSDRVTDLVSRLQAENITVDAVSDLGLAIKRILKVMGFSDLQVGLESIISQEWIDSVLQAINDDRLDVLRELSWKANNRFAIRNMLLENGDTCLHQAARNGNTEMSYWLVTQAGCDAIQRNAKNETPQDVSQDKHVLDMLGRLHRHRRATGKI